MKKPLHLLFTLFLSFFFSVNLLAQDAKKSFKVTCVGFYNLENLFDYQDDSLIRDEEYLPTGEKAWDSLKYQSKLTNMSKVIAEIGTDYSPDGAAILGLCELENKGVVEDLIAMPKLKDRKYKIVHYDSPDRRGIDCALIYQEKYFKYKKSTKYPLSFTRDDGSISFTRDQLVVTGEMDGEDVTFIVVHWPSRWGGKKASQPRRIAAAEVSRHVIDSLQADNPNAKIILMGDLNDDPVNVSLTDYLRAKGKKDKLQPGDMFNPFWSHYKKGNGSLAYRGAWNLFDQICVSQAFLNEDATNYVLHTSVVFKRNWMLQTEGDFKGAPLRTYSFGQWTNGFSDHLPTYIVLKKYAQ